MMKDTRHITLFETLQKKSKKSCYSNLTDKYKNIKTKTTTLDKTYKTIIQ